MMLYITIKSVMKSSVSLREAAVHFKCKLNENEKNTKMVDRQVCSISLSFYDWLEAAGPVKLENGILCTAATLVN